MRINIFNENFFYIEIYYNFDNIYKKPYFNSFEEYLICGVNMFSFYFNKSIDIKHIDTISSSMNIISLLIRDLVIDNNSNIYYLFYKKMIEMDNILIDQIPDKSKTYELCKLSMEKYHLKNQLLEYIPLHLIDDIKKEFNL